MALSAGDGQIIAVIEDDPGEQALRWTRRLVRRHRRFGQREHAAAHRGRRRALTAFLILGWIALLCLDEAYLSGPWLWAALAATWAAIAPAVARSQIRKRG
jgi:hypothetical protein